MDFVFILGLDSILAKVISDSLQSEDPLYTRDCVFLKDGIGPCIFPDNLRPQVCITAFCGGDHGVRKEILRVKRAFIRLGWFIRTRRFRALGVRVLAILTNR